VPSGTCPKLAGLDYRGFDADRKSVSVRRLPNVVVVLLICVGTLGVFGPHLLMIGFKAAGARPPAALAYFCVLHGSHGSKGSPLVIGAHRAIAVR
jgi:hypothetical protein